MTNLEKINEVIEVYEAEIPAMPFNCIVSRVRRGVSLKTSCVDIVSCTECKEKNIKWLLSEYKPQELKNGDGLNTGKLIEVSYDGKGWYKRQFLAYIDGRFWCFNLNESGEASAWRHARIPEKENY